jgi:hypothetical protein
MNRVLIILLTLLTVAACRRDETTPAGGTITINNTLYGEGPYYSLGFSFATASLTRTNRNPKPDIAILAETDLQGDFQLAYLTTSSFLPSFSLYGGYADASAASAAFGALASVPPGLAWTELARPVTANQIWIFRTGEEKYAKIRIISVKGEERSGIAYTECTFGWVFQPDGSTTFPM